MSAHRTTRRAVARAAFPSAIAALALLAPPGVAAWASEETLSAKDRAAAQAGADARDPLEARTAPGASAGQTPASALPRGDDPSDPDVAALAASLLGAWDLVGDPDGRDLAVRLVIARRGGGLEVVRRVTDPATGAVDAMRGFGTIRQGTLLVEFNECVEPELAGPTDPAAVAAAAAAAASAGLTAGGGSALRGGGMAGALTGGERTPAASFPVAAAGAGLELGGSVGRAGVNRPEDVLRIQEALVTLAYLAPGGFEPGVNGPSTVAAIERYQRERAGFRWPDGRVDVDNRTLAALNREEVLGGSAAAPGGSTALPAGAPRAGDRPAAVAPLPGTPAAQLEGMFGALDVNAIVAAYRVRDGRLLGGCRDLTYGAGAPAWGIERGFRAED